MLEDFVEELGGFGIAARAMVGPGERVGSDRLIMGSDYPVGEKDPVGWLKEAGLSGQELADVAGGNAARLVGIKV